MTTAAILGAGHFAAALADFLDGRVPTRVWARTPQGAQSLARRFGGLTPAATVGEACEGAGLVFLAVPASAFREVAAAYGEVARGDHVVVHATRGVDAGFVLPHRVLREETCARKIAVLGGPLAARDPASGRPLAAVLASHFDDAVELIRGAVAGLKVRIHPTRDVVGVEVAGAISCVTAIAVGMSDALGFDGTARGVLMTRGLAEAARLGVALGADASTFTGLAGIGELIPRRVTSTARHHVLGAALADGTPLAQALGSVRGEVEGVATAREAVAIAAGLELDVPLIHAVNRVLHEGAAPRAVLDEVLQLDLDVGPMVAAPRC